MNFQMSYELKILWQAPYTDIRNDTFNWLQTGGLISLDFRLAPSMGRIDREQEYKFERSTGRLLI